MKSERANNYFKSLPKRLLDSKEQSLIIKSYFYIGLGLIAFIMTVLNVFTDEHYLGIATAIFSFISILCMILLIIHKKNELITDILFGFSVIALFTFFIIFGYPSGFSIIWIALMPTISLLFYGVKNGSIVFGVMYLILLFFMWTPIGHLILRPEAIENYSKAFMLRFPFLCAGSYLLSLILTIIKDFSFKELQRVNKINEDLSYHDSLTGLLNRTGIREKIDEFFKDDSKSQIYGIMDIDHFKEINDTHGHLFGDYVLKEFAKILDENFNGLICRYGGDEFAIVIHEKDFNKKDFEKFIKIVQNHDFTYFENTIHITISCGLYKANGDEYLNYDACLNNADLALYKSKQNGKNCYSIY